MYALLEQAYLKLPRKCFYHQRKSGPVWMSPETFPAYYALQLSFIGFVVQHKTRITILCSFISVSFLYILFKAMCPFRAVLFNQSGTHTHTHNSTFLNDTL